MDELNEALLEEAHSVHPLNTLLTNPVGGQTNQNKHPMRHASVQLLVTNHGFHQTKMYSA